MVSNHPVVEYNGASIDIIQTWRRLSERNKSFRIKLLEDPFDQPHIKDEVRPERMILKLPKAVNYRMIDASRHGYEISGIYFGSGSKLDDPKEASAGYMRFISEMLDLAFDFKARTATLFTSRALTLSELAYVIDDMAKLGGDIPYWVELEARGVDGGHRSTGYEFRRGSPSY